MAKERLQALHILILILIVHSLPIIHSQTESLSLVLLNRYNLRDRVKNSNIPLPKISRVNGGEGVGFEMAFSSRNYRIFESHDEKVS